MNAKSATVVTAVALDKTERPQALGSRPHQIGFLAAGANQLYLDGEELAVKTVLLVDDRREHFVELKVYSR